MSESFDDDIRGRLLKLREELEAVAETGEQSSEVVELDQSRVGRLSRMDAMQAQAMSQASGRRREATLSRITASLARLENGDYGVCQSCEEPIDDKRLQFDPTALLCIGCATREEQGR